MLSLIKLVIKQNVQTKTKNLHPKNASILASITIRCSLI